MSNTVEIIITAGVSKALKGLKRVNAGLISVAKSAAALGVAMTGMAILSVKAFASFESAFAGVRKTIDGTEQDFAILAKGIRDMAQEIPASVVEISAVAEAAGQLGIAKENVLDFTRTMIDLGNTTNLTAEVAATQLARLANVTNLPKDKFDELGSTIVGLGNNLATTEAEITEMALRLAGAGSQIGLTQDEILSFSAALSSVGINAEAGGTAFSRVMVEMASSVASGGKKLEQFAAVAGVSVADFKKTFETDASGALVTFVEGLDKTAKSGDNVFATLEEMGFANVRVRDALLRASGAGDLFRRSLEIGSKAWEKNTALTKEAATRYETLTSKWKVTMNVINDVAISIGEVLAPAIIKGLDAVQSFSKAFGRVFQNIGEITDATIEFLSDSFTKFFTDYSFFSAMMDNFFVLIKNLTLAYGNFFAEAMAITGKVALMLFSPIAEAFDVVVSNIRLAWQLVVKFMLEKLVDNALLMANKFNSAFGRVLKVDTTFLKNFSKVLKDDVLPPATTLEEAFNRNAENIKLLGVSIKGNLSTIGTVGKQAFKDIGDSAKKMSDDSGAEEYFKTINGLIAETEEQAIEFSEVVGPAIQKGLTGGGEEGQAVIQEFWDGFGTKVHESMISFSDIAAATWTTFETGFGNAIANVIVRGEDLGTALKGVFDNILVQFIQMIIQMTIRWIAFQALTGGAFGGIEGGVGKAMGFSGGGVVTGGMKPVTAAGGGVFKKPTLAVIGDNPDRQEAVIPMRNGKVGVDLKGGGNGQSMVIQQLNIMPNSSIDEALMNKPASWWLKMFKQGILPAMNSLGNTGTTTTMQSRSGRV